jgi:hypothetical protein
MSYLNTYKITKDFDIDFDYSLVSKNLNNNFNVDIFTGYDWPEETMARTLYERVCDSDISVEQHISELDKTNKLYEYILNAFDTLKGRYNTCREYYFVLAGNKDILPYRTGIQRHLHFKRKHREYCRTVTAIIPLDIVEPNTTYVSFQRTDVPFPELEENVWQKNDDRQTRRMYARSFVKCLRSAQKYEVEKSFFPNKDETLILDFDSTNHIHGVHDFNNNTYIVFICDDCT